LPFLKGKKGVAGNLSHKVLFPLDKNLPDAQQFIPLVVNVYLVCSRFKEEYLLVKPGKRGIQVHTDGVVKNSFVAVHLIDIKYGGLCAYLMFPFHQYFEKTSLVADRKFGTRIFGISETVDLLTKNDLLTENAGGEKEEEK
jgi:hypothetical protein